MAPYRKKPLVIDAEQFRPDLNHWPAGVAADGEKARKNQWFSTHRPFSRMDIMHTMRTPPLLAHCGGWHEVSAVPFTTPCCGTVLLEEFWHVGVLP